MPKKADWKMLRHAGTTWPVTALSFLVKEYLFTLRTGSNSHGHHFIKLSPSPERSSSLLKPHSWEVIRWGLVVRIAVGNPSTRLTGAARAEFPECHKSEAGKQDDNGMYDALLAKKENSKKKCCILILI